MTSDGPQELPPAELLAALDAAGDGWAVASAVRAGDRIVDFRLVYLNEPGARALGRPRDQLLGRRYLDLWPNMGVDGIIDMYADVTATRTPARRNFYYDDGALVGHFEVRVHPLGDGIAICFANVSQATLGRPGSDVEVQLRAALDVAFDGFSLLSAVREDGRITDFVVTYVNEVGGKLIGLDLRDIVGSRVSETSHRPVAIALLQRYHEVAETGVSYLDEVGDPAQGSVWEIKVNRIADDVLALSYRDITDRVRQERQVAASEASAHLAAARAATLQSATAALARAATVADVYAVMTEQLRPFTGWRSLVVMLREDRRLVVSHASGLEPSAEANLRDAPIDDPYPMSLVVRERRAIFYGDERAYVADYPERAAYLRAADRRAWAFIPLLSAGRAIGAMALGYVDARVFDEHERDALVSLGELYAQALERARLFEAQRSIASDLQHALLPAELPSLTGARHAARYLPWTHGADVGGDWYDIIPLGDDSVAVAIGDVAGHSTSAAATMGQLRNALRAYALDGHSPTNVMDRVNRLLATVEPHAMATCCYMELHLAEGTATAVLAGHLPPVLCHDGTAWMLDLRLGLPLGVRQQVTYTDTTLLVPAGSALLLFTDGLVEDRRFPIAEGLAQLQAALSGVPVDDPDELVQRVLTARIGPQPRSDDVALLAITVDGPPRVDGALRGAIDDLAPTATRRFRSDASSAASARRFAADMLSAWGLVELVDNARLLLGEVITNAVQYTVGDVRVRLVYRPDRLRVEVRDGSGRRPALRSVEPDSESGRGLQIVASLADAWGHEARESGGKVVWFELAIS